MASETGFLFPHGNASRLPSAFWIRRTNRLRWLINSAWWAETILPGFFVASVAYAALVLAGRRGEWPAAVFLGAALFLALFLLLFSYLRGRRHFISAAEARARLESALRLQSRLTAAAEGIGEWPDPALWKPGVWRWNTRRLGVVLATGVALIVAAFFVAIPTLQKPLPRPTVKPPALAKVESWLEKLAQSKAIDQSSLEQTREQANQLSRLGAEDWYSHASLEAGDHLEKQVQAGLNALEQNATKIESLLGGAGAASGSDEEAAGLDSELSKALTAMEGNVPSLDRSLARSLRQLDGSKLHSLSAEQLAALKKSLEEGKSACRKCLGEGDQPGEREGNNDSDEIGSGGPGGGGGPPPLEFGKDPVQLGSTKTEGVQNDDFSQAALGQRLGVSTGQHNVDRNADQRAADGGAINGEMAGTGAVWVNRNLTPEEQQQLHQYFK